MLAFSRRGGHWPSVTAVRYPTGGRAMLAPTRAAHLWQYCRAGPWSRRKKAPLCKGGCQPNRLTGGLSCPTPYNPSVTACAVPPPSKRGRQGGRWMTAPTRATHQSHVIARPIGPWQSPGTIYDYLSTNVEATPYREIPTDGIAVLGMTDFYLGAPTPTNQKGPLV